MALIPQNMEGAISCLMIKEELVTPLKAGFLITMYPRIMVMSTVLCKFHFGFVPILVQIFGYSVEDALGAGFVGEEVHGSGSSPDLSEASFQNVSRSHHLVRALRLPLFFRQIVVL